MRRFPIWKTLIIGGKSKDELIGELASKPQLTTLAEKETICLARAKVGDIGFTEVPTTNELWSRIKEIGGLCPAEVGPHLRLALEDQPNGDCFWVAMDQITGSHGRPELFYVERRAGGKHWLHGYYASPDYRWSLSDEFVFVLRK